MQLSAIDISIGLSFLLGMLHALEPGHGKTAMLVYMLRERKSFWHPIIMGLSTAISHALSLILIALAVHLGVHLLSGDEHAGHQHVGDALQWISSVLLVGVGLRLLWLARFPKIHKATCACCRGKSTDQTSSTANKILTSSENSALAQPLPVLSQINPQIASQPVPENGSVTAQELSDRPNYKLTVLLGIAIGLLPCPTALASYFAGMSSGNIWQGYIVIAVFSSGIGLSLAACGFVLQWLGGWIRKFVHSDASTARFSYFQALAIICIGLFYIVRLASTGDVHTH